MALQPYELDIRVTWDEIPSRDDYLASKQRAWARDDSASTASDSAVARIRLGERPWRASPSAQMDRWSFFRELAASKMERHGLTRQSWTVKYDHARARAGQCQHRAKILSFSRNLIARGSLRTCAIRCCTRLLTPWQVRGIDMIERGVTSRCASVATGSGVTTSSWLRPSGSIVAQLDAGTSRASNARISMRLAKCVALHAYLFARDIQSD